MSDLKGFLTPRSIAVVGASDGVEKIGGRIVDTLLRCGFSGALYPINPGRKEIHGLTAWPDLAALPAPADLALICIPAPGVPAAAEACAAAGITNLAVISSGFAEVGDDGAELQAALLEIGRRRGLRIAGPNSEGFFNVPARIAATFSPAVHVDPGSTGPRRRVGVVAQSGGLGFALYNRGRPAGLDFSVVASVGNQGDLEVVDYADALLDDPETAVVLLFIEAIKTPARFLDLARKAARLQKPVVVGKVGASSAGRRAVASHTGSLSGAETAYDAVFQSYGVIRAKSPEEMLNLAAFFTRFPPMPGPRVAIVTTSGGAGVWLADACEAQGLVVPPIDSERQERLKAFLPSFGSAVNPIDLTGQGMDGIKNSLEVLKDSPDIDAIIVAGSFAHEGRLQREGEAIRDIARTCPKPIVLYSYTSPSARARAMLAEWDLHVFATMQGCVGALRAGAEHQAFLRGKSSLCEPDRGGADGEDLRAALERTSGKALCEFDAAKLLSGYGVPLEQGRLVQSADEAVEAAHAIGWPLALKVQSPDIPHKTEAGALRLNLEDPASLKAAFAEVLASARHHRPDADIRGVLAQRMAEPGVEFICGVSRDDDFGPIVMLGLGGIYVELFKDVVFAPAPLSDEQARAMMRRLKAAPLFDGLRGKPPLDVDALADLLVRLSRFAADAGEIVQEIDLNPVLVREAGRGVVAADALIILNRA